MNDNRTTFGTANTKAAAFVNANLLPLPHHLLPYPPCGLAGHAQGEVYKV